VPYVHVVFTLLHRLLPLAYRNSTRLYTWLFQVSAATPREVAADPRHVGAEIGVLSILHTWDQTLVRHPHVRCVVPAGGLSRDHRRWVRPKYAGFFLPVKVLSAITAAEPTACSMGPLITRARFLSYLVGEQEIKMLRAYAELIHGVTIGPTHISAVQLVPLTPTQEFCQWSAGSWSSLVKQFDVASGFPLRDCVLISNRSPTVARRTLGFTDRPASRQVRLKSSCTFITLC